MQKLGLNKAEQYSKAYKRKKLRQRIVSGLAALVVFITTYALILPALTQERPIYCGFDEHSHTASCINGCKLPQHRHTKECYINPLDGKESKAFWESTLPKDLCGIWDKDIISVAQSQIGYTENINNLSTMDQATADSVAQGAYTRYGEWYGDPYYGEWSSLFVNFCLYYSGVSKEYFPYQANCTKWYGDLTVKNLVSATPTLGSIMFFRHGTGVSDRKAAIVTKLIYDNDVLVRVRTVQGDVDGRADYVEYSVNDTAILGYGDLGAAYNEYYISTPQTKTYKDKNVTVSVTYMPSAQIPADAVLEVIPVARGEKEFESCYLQAQEKLKELSGTAKDSEITGFRLYDIHFIHDGQEIQPKDNVDVSVTYPITAYSQTATVSVLHYGDFGTEITESTYTVTENNVKTDFSTESFSLFAVVTSETFVSNIVSLTQYTPSSVSQKNLNGTYAIINGNYALGVEGTKLVTQLTESRTNGVTAKESLACWKFSSAGNGYDIYTVIDDVNYYLTLQGSDFVLTNVPTAFTVTKSNNNVTIKSGNSYLKLTADGAVAASSTALSLYTVPTGKFSVVFDGQIGKAEYMGKPGNYKYGNAEKVTKTTDANGYIKLPTPEETKVPGYYPLRLNGWYDIINGVYYDSSMFGATIRVTGNTTFYPEWIAESYDIGQNKNVVANQPDTSAFIETKVFDYNELFNVHSATYNTSDGKWYFDPNSELGFVFFDYINPSGNIGNIANKNEKVNNISVNEEKTKGQRGSSTNFPGTITAGIATPERIDALFGDTPIVGRIALGEADWLYRYDEESGFYYYNSAANAASYNQSEQRFYVYNHIVTIDSQNSLHDFLPFNYADADTGDTEFAEKNNEANYWFGMSSEITFYLPKDSGNSANKSANGDDMQFRFSGDDDVWVFVDGELVLDLGGVHDVVYGEINFATGEVRTGQAKSSTQVTSNSAATHEEMPGIKENETKGVTTTKLKTLEGGKEHKLTVYYLERGSSLSNCAVYFNLSPLYQLNLQKEDFDGKNLLEGATFQAFEDKECTTPATLYSYENGALYELPDSKFTTNENGIATCWGLFAGKTYYIKEIESPPGYSDMSEYVIEFALSDDAKSVFVMIDSNGTKWEFAGEYVYVGGESHLITLNVYNSKYIGGEKELYVEKEWAEGSKNLPDSIRVWLYANGEETNRSLILSAENNWQASFLELPETDILGNKIVYTVVEEPISGYIPSYSQIEYDKEIITNIDGVFNSVTALTAGNTYRFIGSDGKALGVSGNNLAWLAVNDNDNNQKWECVKYNNGVSLKNLGNGRYFNVTRTGTATSASQKTVTLSSGVLAVDNYKLVYQNSRFSGSTSSSNAIKFDAYQWLPPSTVTETVKIVGLRVTNTPLPEHLSIPFTKLWDATVAESDKTQITASLYLVTLGAEDNPTLIKTATADANGNWQGVFSDVSYPQQGSYYVIIEEPSDYTVAYSGETVKITVNGIRRDAHKVIIGNDGTAIRAEITNARLIVLPDTGGIGILPYIGAGAAMLCIAILLYAKTKKRNFRT